jgi:hypothetical protein
LYARRRAPIALLFALHRLDAHGAAAGLTIDFDAASSLRHPPIGLRREPTSIALEEGLLHARFLRPETCRRTLGAAEAAAEAAFHLAPTRLLRRAKTGPILLSNATEAFETLLFGRSGCRSRDEDR